MKTPTTKRATHRLAASIAIATALATSGARAANTWLNEPKTLDANWSVSGFLALGQNSTDTGILNIGSDSASYDLSVTSHLIIGHSGHGELYLNSGNVNACTSSGNTYIGNNGGSAGLVVVNGGKFIANTGLLVGNGGTGTLVVNSGAVTVNSNTYIGNDSTSTGTFTVNDGTVAFKGDVIVGNNVTGTLTINGGTVEVGTTEKWTKLGDRSGSAGTINLNGGQLKLWHVRKGDGTGSLVFNGGTLVANGVSSQGLIYSNLPVTVNLGGGTIDNGGLAVTNRADISGAGGLTFTGTGTTILNGAVNYSGATAVTLGTTLAVANETAKNNILSHGLVVVGVPTAPGQTVMTYTSALDDADLDKVSCPLAPTTTFKFSDETKTTIVVDTVGPVLDNYWTGAANDSNLSNAANWANGLPTGNACIHCTTPATLTVGDTFAPSSITFLDGSAAVTINGDAINNIVAVTNLSSVSHTINAKVCFTGDIQVKQAAMAETGDLAKAHVTFAGGAYAAAGCSLESGNSAAVYSRCIFGKYYLASTSSSRWTAQYQSGSKRVCIAAGSYLYVPYAGNVSELYVGSGAKVDIGDMDTSGRPSCQVYGEMVVTNIVMTGSSGNTFMTYNQGTATPGVYKFETVTNAKTGGSFAFCDHNAASKHVFYIGAGGINFSGAVGGCYIIGNNKGGAQSETIRPWHSDFTIADRSNSGAAIDFYGAVELCTDDENGVGRKMTIAAKTTSHAYSALTVSGKGKVLVTNTHLGENPTLAVKDSATLAFGENGSLGTGDITLGAGTTLALTADSREFTPLANTLNLPTTGTATIRIDGARLRSGDYVIATVASGDTDNVTLDPDSEALDGRKGMLKVDENGKLVLNVASGGFTLIVY